MDVLSAAVAQPILGNTSNTTRLIQFYRSKCVQVLRYLNEQLVAWACRKYKRFRRRERAAAHWLGGIAKRDPHLLVLWELGVTPAAGTGRAG